MHGNRVTIFASLSGQVEGGNTWQQLENICRYLRLSLVMLKWRQFLATVWRYLRLSPVKFLSLWQIAFISGCPQVAKTILNKKVRDITVLPPWWDDSNGFLISWKFKYPLINILLPWQNWFSSVLETLWKGERLDDSQVLTWPPGHTLDPVKSP